MTPVEPLARTSAELGVDIWCKRDDLFGGPNGGNKWRTATREVASIESTQAVVTCGAVNSNHCRVWSLLAARRHMRLHLVLHGSPTAADSAIAFFRAAGATLEFVEPEHIGPTMDNAAECFRTQGLGTVIVPGGGSPQYAIAAHVEAVVELGLQIQAPPEAIVVALGTGGTHAGLVAGVKQIGWPTRVIGVSVARDQPRAREALRAAMEAADFSPTYGETIAEIDDRHRCGGYGRYGEEELRVVNKFLATENLTLDPVYTAKAMRGLLKQVDSNELGQKGRVIFWHTGGFGNRFEQIASPTAEGLRA